MVETRTSKILKNAQLHKKQRNSNYAEPQHPLAAKKSDNIDATVIGKPQQTIVPIERQHNRIDAAVRPKLYKSASKILRYAQLHADQAFPRYHIISIEGEYAQKCATQIVNSCTD